MIRLREVFCQVIRQRVSDRGAVVVVDVVDNVQPFVVRRKIHPTKHTFHYGFRTGLPTFERLRYLIRWQ